MSGSERRSGNHDHAERGDDQRQFVTHHLRDRPHRAEHRELRSARPAGHEDREFGQRADREEKQQPEFQRHRRPFAAVGNHAEREDRRQHDQDRRRQMQQPLGLGGHDVLLGQHLDAVGDRLEDAEPARAVRTDAVLDAGQGFALDQRKQREGAEKHRRPPWRRRRRIRRWTPANPARRDTGGSFPPSAAAGAAATRATTGRARRFVTANKLMRFLLSLQRPWLRRRPFPWLPCPLSPWLPWRRPRRLSFPHPPCGGP